MNSLALKVNPFLHEANLQQTTLKILVKNMRNLYKWRYNYWNKLKTLWQKVNLLVLSNNSICHNVFKSPLLQMCQNVSIMWERVKGPTKIIQYLIKRIVWHLFCKPHWKHCNKKKKLLNEQFILFAHFFLL